MGNSWSFVLKIKHKLPYNYPLIISAYISDFCVTGKNIDFVLIHLILLIFSDEKPIVRK